MEIIYFFEYRFPKPADFHFEMKQSSAGSLGPGEQAALTPAAQGTLSVGPCAHPRPQGSAQRPAELCFLRCEMIYRAKSGVFESEGDALLSFQHLIPDFCAGCIPLSFWTTA